MNLCLAFAELWAHKLTRANSFDNGDDSAGGGLTSLFAIMAADPCPQRYEEIKDGIIDWFIEIHASNPKREYYINVDYHPDSYISDICKTLRINPNNAPWKSYCRIQFAGDLVTPVSLVWAFGYRIKPEQRAMQEEARLLGNAISGGTALDLKPWQEYFRDYLEKYLP